MSKKKIIVVSVLAVIFLLITGLVVFDVTKSIDLGFYNSLMNLRCDFLDKYFVFKSKIYSLKEFENLNNKIFTNYPLDLFKILRGEL